METIFPNSFSPLRPPTPMALRPLLPPGPGLELHSSSSEEAVVSSSAFFLGGLSAEPGVSRALFVPPVPMEEIPWATASTSFSLAREVNLRCP